MSSITENNTSQTPASSGQEQAPATPAASKPRIAKKNNRLKVTIANLLVFVIVSGTFIWLVRSYFHIGDKDFTNAAQVEEFINPINTRVSAYITEIRFIEHQPVKKGDTLITLDDREIITQVGQAEAAYQNALASRHVTASTINTVSNNLSVTDANIAGAKARLENAARNLDRYENLLKSEAVTRFQYDQIKTGGSQVVLRSPGGTAEKRRTIGVRNPKPARSERGGD
jgi:membrane fusion protein (multidrug efflux system)